MPLDPHTLLQNSLFCALWVPQCPLHGRVSMWYVCQYGIYIHTTVQLYGQKIMVGYMLGMTDGQVLVWRQ